METPKPGPAQEKLKRFVGEWRGEEKLHPNPLAPEGGVREATIVNRLGLDGFAIIQDYVQADAGEPTYRGHGVITHDGQADEFLLHWFDVWAGSVFRGAFDGERMECTCQSPQGWHRIVYEFDDDDSCRFQMLLSQDGENWSPMMDAAYKKV